MRVHTTCIFLLVGFLVNGQVKNFESRKEAQAAIKGGEYKTSIGWILRVGDEITLGKGTMPDKTFAFITEMPNVLTYNQYTDYNKQKLSHNYNGRSAVIAQLYVAGNKRAGFFIVAKLKVGQMSRYVLDVENAIDVDEVLVPKEFGKKSGDNNDGSIKPSIADELKKLKELYDSGALSKEEYEAAKKKVLDQ